jgi:hypothetical protein
MTPIFAFAGIIQPFDTSFRLETKSQRPRENFWKACRGASGTSVYARPRARAVPLRRRRIAAAAVIDRMILDDRVINDRVMGGHIDAVSASVNARVRPPFTGRPHSFAVRMAYLQADSSPASGLWANSANIVAKVESSA